MARSSVNLRPGAEPQWGNMGLAMESATVPPPGPPNNQFAEPSVLPRLTTMLRRMTRCPGDFDRDGVSEPDEFDPNADLFKFKAAYQQAGNPLHIYADWSFDGKPYPGDPNPDPNGWQADKADGAKFNAGFGTQPGGCPNN